MTARESREHCFLSRKRTAAGGRLTAASLGAPSVAAYQSKACG